jgi:hypothetical protein
MAIREQASEDGEGVAAGCSPKFVDRLGGFEASAT